MHESALNSTIASSRVASTSARASDRTRQARTLRARPAGDSSAPRRRSGAPGSRGRRVRNPSRHLARLSDPEHLGKPLRSPRASGPLTPPYSTTSRSTRACTGSGRAARTGRGSPGSSVRDRRRRKSCSRAAACRRRRGGLLNNNLRRNVSVCPLAPRPTSAEPLLAEPEQPVPVHAVRFHERFNPAFRRKRHFGLGWRVVRDDDACTGCVSRLDSELARKFRPNRARWDRR